jgi:hypothetical protein
MTSRCAVFILRLAAALALVLASASARAQGPQSGPSAWAGQAPTSADVVLVIKDAARLRATPAGTAMRDLLSRAGLLAGTRSSWDALATRLGLAREEAFDALVGGQVMIIVSGLSAAEQGAEPAWAVLSRVDSATDQRLLERLDAAPRGEVAGHPLRSLEHGKYELAVHRSKDGQGPRVLVLGPRQRPELFDRVLRGVNDQPLAGETTLSMAPVAKAIEELGDADAIVLVRMDDAMTPGDAGAAPAWTAYAAISLSADDSGVSARCVMGDPGAEELLKDGAGGPSVNLDRAFPGALIAIVEHPPTKAALRQAPLAAVLAAVRMPDPLQQALASGQMVVMEPSAAAPGVSVGAALRLSDPMKVAPLADAFMVGVVQLLDPAQVAGGGGAGAAGPGAANFAGVAPRAMRSLSVPAWAGLSGLNWPSVWLSWAYTPDRAPGWWLIGAAGEAQTGPSGREQSGQMVAKLREGALEADAPGRVLSQAVVRPAALARAISPAVPDLGNWREVLSRVDEIRWNFDIGHGGRIDGVVRVNLMRPEGGKGR